ncbi:mycothiol synthase [Kineococcus sp. TRM81007]|uniref:mycothiol synthase n=1 Tax=Kineococcus sp. TRM81007 TaxID=2925831 RepID=UPI001F5924CE|nr:mycothiol synthase [Kineococcus sp. TRM81007]MCI2238621.1 mycothiol synthase [Kineococcus sp. TRM81007]
MGGQVGGEAGGEAGARRLEVVDGPVAPAVRAGVERLAAAVSAADGTDAVSEDALLRLRTGGDGVRHLLLHAPVDGAAAGDAAGGSVPAGYAQLAVAGEDLAGELLVHPSARRRGHGRALLERVGELAAGRRALLWAHGDSPAAAALAAGAGWERARELLRMQRATAGLAELAEPALPPGVRVRPFVPGADEAAWTALNAAAFAQHPEQGRWTVEDLRLREGEEWFDPSVLLLAQGSEGLLGFCWMKVQPHVSELYVLGVHPGAAGRGLGRALLVRGLRAVAGPGAPGEVELYVDGGNVPAVRLYEALGFARAAVDVQYASAPGS